MLKIRRHQAKEGPLWALRKGKETDVKEDDHVLKLLKKLKVEVTM